MGSTFRVGLQDPIFELNNQRQFRTNSQHFFKLNEMERVLFSFTIHFLDTVVFKGLFQFIEILILMRINKFIKFGS